MVVSPWLIQEFKLELHDLRRKVKALPELLSEEMDKTTKLTDQFGSMKMSNMEGKHAFNSL